MKNINKLPAALLMLCWAAVVKSDNSSLSPVYANTTTTSQSSTVSITSTSGSALITAGPSSSATYNAGATFTGTDPDDLVPWCYSQYQSYLNASGTPTVYSTASNTGYYFVGPLSDVTLSSSQYSDTVTLTSTIVPPGYTSPPQCVTGCVIQAQEVGLQYWPTPRAAPNATTSAPSTITPPPSPLSAVVDGSTLYSPSNYLVFTNISAIICNLDLSPCTYIGPVVPITTMAFGQSELSSENCFHETSVLDYRDFNSPIPWSIVTTQIGCTILTESHPGSYLDPTFTLKPSIVFPTEVKTAINTDWSSCTFILGLYDPPSSLTPVQQLTGGPGPGTTTDVKPTSTDVPAPIGPISVESSVYSLRSSTLKPFVPTSTKSPDPPVSTIIPDPPTSTAGSDPPSSTIVAVPPVSSNVGDPPADPGTSTTALPVDPVTTSADPTLPGKSDFAPGPSTSTDPQSLGSIIASVGGFNGNDPPPASTITLPGPSSVAGAAPSSPVSSEAGGQPVQVTSPVVTTLPGQVVSVAPGISSTLPGAVITVSAGGATTIPQIVISVGGSATTIPAVTISASLQSQSIAGPAPSSAASLPAVTATIGGQTITIAPNGASATVSSQTVTAGGTAITVSGTTVSIGTSSIVVGSTTVAIITPPTITPLSSKVGGSGYLPGSNATASLPVQASGGYKIGIGIWGVLMAFTAWSGWIGL